MLTTNPPRAWIPGCVFLVMLLGICTTGYLLYKHNLQELERTTREGLNAIADLKVGQITRWLGEQYRDADGISRNNLLADAAGHWFQQGLPEDEEARDIHERLASLRQINRYQSIALLDDQGRLRLEDGVKFDINDTKLVLQALRENVVMHSGIHWSAGQTPELGFVAPLAIQDLKKPHVIGAVIFNVNLNTFLFPYIQQWPTPSTSGETLLVRRDGNEVLVLNELRHRKDAALSLRLPIDQPSLPAAMALLGEDEVMAGVDYRGVPVYSTTRKVPDTPWVLISKLDKKEVEAPLRSLAITAGLLMTLIIILGGAVAFLWWRKQLTQHRAELYREELQHQALAQHLDYAAKYARDMIMLIDETGRIIECNNAVMITYGYTQDELLHLNQSELRAPRSREQMMFADLERMVQDLDEGITYETVHRRKDGGEFPVEVSLRRIEIEGKRYLHLVLRDITRRKQMEEISHASELKYRRLFESARDGILILEGDSGRIIDVNSYLCELLGSSRDRFIGQHLWDIGMFKDVESSKTTFHRLQEQGYVRYDNLPLQKTDGQQVEVEFISNVYEVNGDQVIQCNIRDISERKAQEHRIARLTRIHTVLSNINSTIVRVNRRSELFTEACRIAVEHGLFRMVWIGLVDETTQDIKAVAWQGQMNFSLDEIKLSVNPDVPAGRTVAGQAMRDKMPVICNDIEKAPELIYGEVALAQGYRSMAIFPLVVAEKVVGIFSLFSEEQGFFDMEEVDLLKELTADISFALDHLEKAESVHYLAYYDVLTGLPNHAFFMEHFNRKLQQELSEDRLEALVLVDIERFHIINDTLGRHVGDRLLKIIAQRLEKGLAEHGMFARLEGDRFAFSLSGMETVAAVAHFVEHDINNCFTNPFTLEGKDLRLAARFGIALYPYDGNDAETLFKNAETALNRTKRTAEPLLFFAPVMNDRMTEMLVLEGKLQQAIRAGQFVLHYQPQVDAVNGHITGMEALIRWNDPDTGMVPPNDFIPLLEDTGLIVEVGRWVLEQAAADYTRWHDQGLHPPCIAVNVSTLQLRRADFISVIKSISDTLPENNCLELEITESLIMEDVEENIQKLAAVRDLGINTVIDDFGTGYSSLRYIARLPIHAVKIDRGFIVNMTHNNDDMTIVSMILSLAHELDLKVTAEGVDTEEQLKMLRLLKCDEIQGFLYSKPLPFGGIEQLLRNGNVLLPV